MLHIVRLGVSTHNVPHNCRQHLAAGEVREDSAEEDDNGSDDGEGGDSHAQHHEPTSRQVRQAAVLELGGAARGQCAQRTMALPQQLFGWEP